MGSAVTASRWHYIEAAVAGYLEAVETARSSAAADVLAAFARFQVLCASRHGRLGVTRMNVTI